MTLFKYQVPSIPSLRIGGSVVEFSPATREARVRFPADAIIISATTEFSFQYETMIVGTPLLIIMLTLNCQKKTLIHRQELNLLFRWSGFITFICFSPYMYCPYSLYET